MSRTLCLKRKQRKRKAISEIISTLLVILITISLGITVLAFSSSQLDNLSSSFLGLVSGSGQSISNNMVVEQVQFGSSLFVPISITNSQTSTTAAPFQQVIIINPSLYTTLEAQDLGNIRFYSTLSGKTFSGPIDSWLEYVSSTPANTATTATFWLNLPNGIAGSTSINIYMTFLSTSTEFDGRVAGEAPQLSSTYGQYDNGANVFNFYDNFVGTSLSSKWQAPIASSGGTVSVNNGITFSVASSSDYVFLPTASTIAYPQVSEMLFDPGGTSTVGIYPTLGETTSTTTSNWIDLCPGYEYDWETATGGSGYLVATPGCSSSIVASGLAPATSDTVVGFAWDATGNEQVYDGYSNIGSGTDTSVSIANYYPYFGISNFAPGSYMAQWFRTRAYPPNGVMPSATPSSLTQTGKSVVNLYVRNDGTTQISIATVYLEFATNNSVITTVNYSPTVSLNQGSFAVLSVYYGYTAGLPYTFIVVAQDGSKVKVNALA
ncbi:MAG: archaellin/type IV pilin N-terminal domain-containing protein [Nitrososphaerales archaeon]